MPPAALALLERIERRDACVAVVGLGYVGLPLAALFVQSGFRVIGVDVDARKVGRNVWRVFRAHAD